jgi:hypothetical protein
MPKKGKEKEVQGKSQGKKAQQEPKHQANNKTQKLQTTNRPKYTAHLPGLKNCKTQPHTDVGRNCRRGGKAEQIQNT